MVIINRCKMHPILQMKHQNKKDILQHTVFKREKNGIVYAVSQVIQIKHA